jgi:protocatechuate 3,4-dioxygenase beta subunit
MMLASSWEHIELDTPEGLLAQALSLHRAGSSPRLNTVVRSLLRHLYAFAAEVHLTREEWQAGVAFLNRVGRASTVERDEFMLLSDVLGLSSLVDILTQPAGATEGTVLGPFYLPDSPQRPNGGSLIDQDDGGEQLTVFGVVRSTDGRPLPEAIVDVWSCASNGLYAAQDPRQPPTNMRGLIKVDADGGYEFTLVRPTNYSVPTDGPVGEFLRAAERPTQRAAHVHLTVSAPGHSSVITHLFDSSCPYINSDAVFSVRGSLVRDLERADSRAWCARFDVVLKPADET